jgi:hypothetical protein
MWGALVWGIDLGQGWTTFISFSGYYGLVVWSILAGKPYVGVFALGAYGLGRALPVVVAGAFATRLDLGVLGSAYIVRLPLIRRMNSLALAFVAGYLITGL